MDTYLQGQILTALINREFDKLIGYGLIFLFIWLQVRGLKKSVNALNKTLVESFADSKTKFAEGELRFEAIEANQLTFEHRLTKLETSKGELS